MKQAFFLASSIDADGFDHRFEIRQAALKVNDGRGLPWPDGIIESVFLVRPGVDVHAPVNEYRLRHLFV